MLSNITILIFVSDTSKKDKSSPIHHSSTPQSISLEMEGFTLIEKPNYTESISSDHITRTSSWNDEEDGLIDMKELLDDSPMFRKKLKAAENVRHMKVVLVN